MHLTLNPYPPSPLSPPQDVFGFSKPGGVIGPQTTSHVTLTFRSPRPANFWKRVACLIKDADPLSLDLLATSYDEKNRPPPLTLKHVNTYMARVGSGGSPVDADLNANSMPPTPAGPLYSRGNVADGGRVGERGRRVPRGAWAQWCWARICGA